MINEYEVDLSYEDLVKYYKTIKIKSRLSKKSFEKKLTDSDFFDTVLDSDNKEWEEDSVGSGFDINVDEIREIGKDKADQKIMVEVTIPTTSKPKARKILEKWLESDKKKEIGYFHIENEADHFD